MKARIRGVQTHMQRFDFFFGLTLGDCLLRNADNLGAGLQSKGPICCRGKNHGHENTVKAISLMRSDEGYGLLWQKVIQNAERKGVAKPSLPRQKRMPACFENGNVVPEYHETAEAYFRQIYFEAIDHLVNAIQERFDLPDFAMYANAEHLLLKCVRGEVFEEEYN
ncbi:unnamed protein product [Mytilus coruscus]|uniref:Uncharacterized protein n=1 Tax=Mytilus coruscus TaxID=42192 RepID=A0A6J8BAB2_MYTCO|nr:unnamed protein product [Mytilus coruscus]